MSWHGYAADPASLEASFAAGTGARRSVRPAVRNALGRWARGVLSSRARMALKSSASARTASATLLSQRRRRRPEQQVIKGAQGGPSTSSQFVINKSETAITKTIKRACNPQYYVTNDAYQVICSQGFQEASFVSWQNSRDLYTMLQKIPLPVAGAGGAANLRYVLDSTQCELLITNSTLATAFVELYDIARKRDTNSTTYPPTADPVAAWAAGILNAEPVGSPHTYNDINCSPYDSQTFKDWFTVLKKTRVEMPQGGMHRHHVNIHGNLLVSGDVLAYVNGDPADYTYYTMIVFKGQPASAQQDATTVVTTAKIALDVVQSTRYKFSFSDSAPTAHTTTDNLSTIGGEQVISAGAGTIVPNAIV